MLTVVLAARGSFEIVFAVVVVGERIAVAVEEQIVVAAVEEQSFAVGVVLRELSS